MPVDLRWYTLQALAKKNEIISVNQGMQANLGRMRSCFVMPCVLLLAGLILFIEVSLLIQIDHVFGNKLRAASSSASALGRPIITPPSATASVKIQAKAGPEPESAVQASK